MQKLRETLAKFAKTTSEWSEGKLNSAVSNGRCQKIQNSSHSREEKGRFFRSFDEYKFLICTVFFSVSIVILKILFANRDNFHKLYVRGRRLMNTPYSLTNFNFLPQLSAALSSVWTVLVDLNWLFIPAVVGVATTFITWRVVYWDSRIPGVQPPSPFSLKVQNKKQSFLSSSGYTFALYTGIFVFFVLVLWGIIST